MTTPQLSSVKTTSARNLARRGSKALPEKRALSPATVLSVTQMGEKSAVAVVPDDKLSLAIGRDGQNARLAARLTGWKIDVKSESAAAKLNLEAPAEASEE